MSIGRQRLMALGDYALEQSESAEWCNRFDMASYFHDDGCYNEHFRAAVRNVKPGQPVPVGGDCGTAGCLLGHGVNVPMLKEAGLSNVLTKNREVHFTLDGVELSPHHISRHLFGINDKRFNDIFMPAFGERFLPPKEAVVRAVNRLREVVRQIDENEGWRF